MVWILLFVNARRMPGGMAKRCKKSGMREMTDPSFVAKLPTPVQPGSGSKGLSQPARRHPRLQTPIQA